MYNTLITVSRLISEASTV